MDNKATVGMAATTTRWSPSTATRSGYGRKLSGAQARVLCYPVGLRVCRNRVRPHLGLPDGLTPGEAAGITIEGQNKILAMIQAAAK